MTPAAWVSIAALCVVVVAHVVVVTAWLVRIDARTTETNRRLDWFTATANKQLSRLTGWMIGAGFGSDRRRPPDGGGS